MKKNANYVGVDDQYIPEDEKYVDNQANSEIKGVINDGIKSATNYVKNPDNQEKMKNVGRKGLKIAKGFGIGYLVFVGIVIIMAIAIFALVFSQFFKISKQGDEMRERANGIIDRGINTINEQSDKMDADDFNFGLESYSGTKYGSLVTSLLDKVVTKIKKNTNHPITVIYGSTTTSKPDEITSLKKQLESSKQYEVSMDYDSNGYISKITIADY